MSQKKTEFFKKVDIQINKLATSPADDILVKTSRNILSAGDRKSVV